MALAIRSSIPAEVWRAGPEEDLLTAFDLLAEEDGMARGSGGPVMSSG